MRNGRSPLRDWSPREPKFTRALRDFCESGRWHEHIYGPEPGAPGCKIPADILAEFGFANATQPRSESVRPAALH